MAEYNKFEDVTLQGLEAVAGGLADLLRNINAEEDPDGAIRAQAEYAQAAKDIRDHRAKMLGGG